MPGKAFILTAEKNSTFLHFTEDCEEIKLMTSNFDHNNSLMKLSQTETPA